MNEAAVLVSKKEKELQAKLKVSIALDRLADAKLKQQSLQDR